MERKIITTEDGSTTLFVPELNEHYHSIHGAVQESNHVFIDAGLSQVEQDTIVVFEVGFGTGLNAFLTYEWALKNKKKVVYYSIEKYPISADEIEKLNYAEALGDQAREHLMQLHDSDWGVLTSVNEYFSLCKLEDDMTSVDFATLQRFDLIYFDAFAPDVQPKLWTQDIFDKIFSQSAESAILTTYCAKGVVRRTMIASGFIVERIPGPPGKREMLRARK